MEPKMTRQEENTSTLDDDDATESYLEAGGGLRSWLFATDHKRIALLYLCAVTVFFILGTLFASLMRIELSSSDPILLSDDLFNRLFTLHGLFMIFLVLMPAIPAVLGNFLVPLKIGARNFAFPRLNLLGFYLFLLGGACLVMVALRGGIDSTWTLYPAFTAATVTRNVVLTACGVLLTSWALLLMGINTLVTIHKMRAPGLYWSRLPIFVWSQYAAAVIMVLATPVLAGVLFVLGLDKLLGAGVFDTAAGGGLILFRRLFWFWARPALYIMVLPAIGIVTEILSSNSRRRPVGYRFIVGSLFSIVFLSFLTAGGHLIVSSQSVFASLVASLAGYLVAIPFAVILANWIAMLYRASISLRSPLLYAVGFIALTMIGGLTGLFLSAAAANVHLHGTLFVVAHFHYLLAGAVVMAYLAGLHFWWPKITGRAYPEATAAVSVVVLFVGLNLTFFPQFLLGSLGVPRRHFAYPFEFEPLHLLSTAGFTVLVVGYLLPMAYLLWSLRSGDAVDENPAGATGLEWRLSSPPPAENFMIVPAVGDEQG
jgi:cytochrome c oxidase subunit 1